MLGRMDKTPRNTRGHGWECHLRGCLSFGFIPPDQLLLTVRIKPKGLPGTERVGAEDGI